jgi:hypothetical protein
VFARGTRAIRLTGSEERDMGLFATYLRGGKEVSELILYRRLVSFSANHAVVKDNVLVDAYDNVTIGADDATFMSVTAADGETATLYRSDETTIEIWTHGQAPQAADVANFETSEAGAEDEEAAEEDGEEGEYEEDGEAEEGEDGEYEDDGEGEEAEDGEEYEEDGEGGEEGEGEYEEDGEEGEEGEEEGEDGDGFDEEFEDYDE